MASTWRIFDRVAADYDSVVPFFAAYGAAIVDVLGPAAGSRFLDLGAGRGALTAAALARGCVVTAVDAAPTMVTLLATDHPEVDARVMDAEALTLPDGCFDEVAASFVIHVLDSPPAGVAEAFRVLRPGGRFSLTGGSARHHDAEPAVWSSPLADRVDSLFLEFAPHLPPGGSMGSPIDAADLLDGAGFVDLHEEHATVEIVFEDTAQLWAWALSHGYRAFIEDLPDAHRPDFRERLLTLPLSDGLLRRRTCVWSGRRPPS
ncbi:class I SAM-dependent methyltransferase [Actinoplanes campanulatus]|uniref:class I SAM-dependent methyltransferase n=1 Tax=Actinoplanes campanulatus TaxID=113559 RepID=UPI00195481F3|nr:class I SAM-dependent methyltransferase [Actinoplanes capillaceus]